MSYIMSQSTTCSRRNAIVGAITEQNHMTNDYLHDAKLFKAKHGSPTWRLQSLRFLVSHVTALPSAQRHLVSRASSQGNFCQGTWRKIDWKWTNFCQGTYMSRSFAHLWMEHFCTFSAQKHHNGSDVCANRNHALPFHSLAQFLRNGLFRHQGCVFRGFSQWNQI
jgi:hypothetical protein